MDKVAKIVGGGSVINGATPSSFLALTFSICIMILRDSVESLLCPPIIKILEPVETAQDLDIVEKQGQSNQCRTPGINF